MRFPITLMGPPPLFICAPYERWPAWDPQTGGDAYAALVTKTPPCQSPLRSPDSDDQLIRKVLKILDQENIIGVASGSMSVVERWKSAGGRRIIPAVPFDAGSGLSLEELRQGVKEGRISMFAELQQQYQGKPLNNPALDPYYALAEQLDVPLGIHMGPGPPGVAYFGLPKYRARLSSLLELEEVLVRHPKLRVVAMHGGWPLINDALAALYAHPQLYIGIGVVSYVLPKAELYYYLQRFIEAGFENRILFGSDQLLWPEAIPIALENIRSAPFLTEAQKRNILYNNAARFLRLPHQ